MPDGQLNAAAGGRAGQQLASEADVRVSDPPVKARVLPDRLKVNPAQAGIADDDLVAYPKSVIVSPLSPAAVSMNVYAASAAGQGVDAGPACENVVAAKARKDIGLIGSRQAIGSEISSRIDRAAHDDQRLDTRRDGHTDIADPHRIVTASCSFDDYVAGIVHNIGVIAVATLQAIRSRSAVQQVVAAVAVQPVDTRATEQLVVAVLSEQIVVPREAIEGIVSIIAPKGVVDRIAGQHVIEGRTAETLDVDQGVRIRAARRLRPGDPEVHVHPARGGLVGGDVEAITSVDPVIARAADQPVIAGESGNDDRRRPGRR